jgi:hypothetical protein
MLRPSLGYTPTSSFTNDYTNMPSLTIGHDVKLHYRTSFKTRPEAHKPCILMIHPVFSALRAVFDGADVTEWMYPSSTTCSKTHGSAQSSTSSVSCTVRC